MYFSGYGLVALISFLEISSFALSGFLFWILALFSATLIAVGNVSRWANVAHPILHGAYDKVPGVPFRYTKAGFAKDNRRYLDWLDWIKPEAWIHEHNIMHHYHLGEDEDPDNVENNLQWLIQSKTPMWLRYVFVYAFAGTWKLTYYAPNTLKILENKKRRKLKLEEVKSYEVSPFKKNGAILWKQYILPYFSVKFILIPFLFLPLGLEAVFNVFIITLIAEYIANLHSFLVIVPNHSAEDIYRFDTPHKSQGEFYLRQIMGSVNYNTGSNLIDFGHGWLNYQIEHHLFPNLPLSQYQKLQPLIKDLCKKHNLEYRQESVFKRMYMTIELMVGKTKLLKVNSI
ncbi:fatty acid desaturase family protein [Arcobacter peruensis]|uniref:fatty acid desaturase family protein n=1 Tax=Arcobacter peruensis TaxID=2320140 RepID=UPI001D1944DB|nr:fatty acid desaturase [Arcobacter peruensis]